MAAQVKDTFTGTAGTDLLAHTGEVGATWTRHPAAPSGGQWLLSDVGRTYAVVGSYDPAIAAHDMASGVAPATGHDVYAIWRFLSHVGDTYHGIFFCYDGTANSGYRLVYRGYSAFRYWLLEKVVAGAASDLGNVTWSQVPAVNSDTAILIECRPTGITVKFDGVTRITSGDTAYVAQGRTGLWAIGNQPSSNTTGYHVALLSVADPGQAVVADAAVAPSTHRTATVAGNWSNPATWGGDPVPGIGDDFKIDAAVILDVDATTGASGAAGSVAGTIGATGSLTWAVGKTLRIRGDLIVSGTAAVDPLTNVRLSMVAGCGLVFDSTAAAAGVRYRLQMGTSYGQTPLLRVRGTSAARATIKSDTTGGALPAFYYDAVLMDQGSIDAEYLDITDFGTATLPAWAPYPGSDNNCYVRLDHVTLTRCGDVAFVVNLTGGMTFILNEVRCVATAGAWGFLFSAVSAKAVGKVREITYSSFDKRPKFDGLKDFTVHHCVFEDVWAGLTYGWASFHDNFVRDSTTDGFNVMGDLVDCYYFSDAVGGNPHGINCTLDQDWTVRGLVIEANDGGGGDFIFPANPASPRVTTLENCLQLPTAGLLAGFGHSAGKIASMLGGVNTTARVRHCTYVVNDQESGVQTGETYPGHAGMVSDLSSNLVWTPTGDPGGWKYFRLGTVQDALPASAANYNWGWNLAAGSEGKGYHATIASPPMFTTGTAGVNDGVGNPGFVDADRNLAKWATVVLGSGAATVAGRRVDAIAALRADPARINEMVAYVRAGFAPTNPAMQGAAKDAASPTTAAGGTPGAIAYASATTTTSAVSVLHVYDTFKDTDGTYIRDHVGQLGATWTRHPTTPSSVVLGWRIHANRVSCVEGAYKNALFLASGVAGTAEHDVVAVWHFFSNLSDSNHGIVFGYDPAADTGYRLFYESYYLRWTLQKVTAGVVSVPSWSFSQGLVAGADYKVRVRLRSTGIAVLIDGVTRITSPDTAYATAAGQAGLFGSGSGGAEDATGMHLDLLAVTGPDAPLPDYDMAGPSAGTPGLASIFTITLAAGINPGTATFTMAVGGMTGTFTPPTLTLTNTIRQATFAFKQTGTLPGTGTISVSDGAGLSDPPPLTYTTSYGPPARISAWRSRVAYTHAGGTNPFVAGSALAIEYGGHYDPIRCVGLAQAYCVRTGLPPSDWSAEAGFVAVDYRNLVFNSAAGGGLQWWHRYPTGLAEDYRRTGNPASRQAIDLLLSLSGPGSYGLDKPGYLADYAPVGNTRPLAFQLLAMMDREWAGLPVHSLTDAAASLFHGYVDEWLGVSGPFYRTWIKPFMAGLLLRAVISYWDRYKDATEPTRAGIVASIPGDVLRLLDYLWNQCWIPPDDANPGWTHGAATYQIPAESERPPITGLTIATKTSLSVFTLAPSAALSTINDYYKGSAFVLPAIADSYPIVGWVGSTRQMTLGNYLPPGFNVGDTVNLISTVEPGSGPGPVPVVNPMVAPAYAWAYWYVKRVLGDAAGAVVHRGRHDAMFDGQQMAWTELSSQKQWNQVFWWATMGLDWRDRGDAEWPAASAFLMEAPATGAAGAHSVASGPFRLSLPYGVKAAAPIHVVPAASTGRGTFMPADVILTSDRPTAMFTFTPSPLDDGMTIPVAVSAAGLTAPAAVAYAVGTASASYGRFRRIGARFDGHPLTHSSLVR